MSIMNIAGLTPVDDPSYRYKMPRIVAKVEGRGNGIKTVLVNVTDVGQALNREAPEITKFFGCELGSQTTYAADTDRAVVNGAHTAADLQNHLSRYIESYVLCKQCKLPETHYKIKDGIISQKCLACGNKDAVDMTHKLTTFILAQHKKNKELAKQSDKKDKDKDKTKSKSKKAKEEEPAPAEEASTSTKKSKKKSDESKTSSKKKTSGDAEGAPDSTGGVVVEEEDESHAADEAIDRFRLWKLDNADCLPATALEELRIIQTFAALRVQDRIIIFLGAVFTEALLTADEILQHKDYLQLLAPSQIQQRHLIAAFEWFCGTRHPTLSKLFPVVLKRLFDEDLVEEEVFYAWATDLTRNEHSADTSMISIEQLEQLRASAAPFITWLQEAEEEGDEDEEEGNEEEEEEEEDDA